VNLRDQGFPVDVNPVTPQRRAEQAVTEQQEALAKSELVKLQSKLADAEARAATATKEAEAAQAKEEKATKALKDEKAARATLEEQLRVAKNDVAEYEKMLAEESGKREAAEKQLQSLKARAEVEKSSKKS
jgi:chromosome segregation ATPase